ncbi:probable receptor-like protein kinase isoform X1 [Tanacetum coccineum]
MSFNTGEAEILSSSSSAQSCRLFSLSDIQFATNDFDDKLVVGRGGFGRVYKGRIRIRKTNHLVAIKRLDSMSDQGELEFRAETEILSKLRHPHLVPLIGYCDDNKEMILVYKYIPHGTLYDHLHKAKTPLSWIQRLQIAIGAGCGLNYLHTGDDIEQGIIHRDVKSSNILLDKEWEAMFSDFGLSKIGPTNQSFVDASVKGTFGYLDPEYFYTRKLTKATDVYAFGVVLFELLSGRLPVDISYGEEQCSLVRWAQKCCKKRKFEQMVDLKIRGTMFPKCLRQFAQIADRCLLSVPKQRPTMTEVVASLHAVLRLQEKHDNSVDSLHTMGFTWRIHKYLVSTTKQNSDQSGTSLPKSLGNNMDGGDIVERPHQHAELVAKDVKLFTYGELECATWNFGFDTCLGVGTHGTVYKGWVDNTTNLPCKHDTGLLVSVIRLHSYELLDLKMLKEFSHPNLVKFIGYCLFEDQLFLVHEFMLNGNFEDHLLSRAIAQLPLVTKVKIAVEIARGIRFLHVTEYDTSIRLHEGGTIGISRLNRHKILFDEDFTVKLAGYDITKLVHGHYPQSSRKFNGLVDGDYYPGSGEQIFSESKLEKIDLFWRQRQGISLSATAEICFEICNDVDSESKMLKLLKNTASTSVSTGSRVSTVSGEDEFHDDNPPPPPVTPIQQAPYTLSTIKLPIMKKSEYDIWAMKMKHYLGHTYYPIWEVIQKGNGPVQVSTDTNGQIRVFPPKTAEEILAIEREIKARANLAHSLNTKDHLANISQMTNSKEM